MALTESKVLAQVTVLPESNSVNVRWDTVVMRDEEVISRQPHRKAYAADQKAEFLAEVEGAEAYIAALGWNNETPEEE